MQKKKKNILVLGANGLLGTMFREQMTADMNWRFAVRNLESQKTNTDIAFDCETTDINKWCEIIKGFDVVINCAAVTQVDLIESTVEYATSSHFVNFKAVDALAKACCAEDVTLIHFSTDYVFNGMSNRPYSENDAMDPINAYGRDKMRGECAICESGCKYLIFRTSWVYSHNEGNFFTNIIEKFNSNEEVNGVVDIISSPTYALDLANAVIKILETNQEHKIGIYHYTNEGVCTRYDFIKAISDEHPYGIHRIFGVGNDYFQCPARRPYCSVLSKLHFAVTFDNIRIPHWVESVKECYKNWRT